MWWFTQLNAYANCSSLIKKSVESFIKPQSKHGNYVPVKLGTILTYALLALLVLTPVLTYYDDLVLFVVGGIEINVRFVLLAIIFLFSFLVSLLRVRTRIPKILLLFLLFTFWGVGIAVFQLLSVRWWLPPLMRWGASLATAYSGYALARGAYLSQSRFHKSVAIALIVPLAVGIYQAVFDLAPLLNGALRVSGTFAGSPLGYSLFLTGMSLLLLSGKLAVYHRFLLILAFVMTIATHSRLPIMAFAIAFSITIFLQKRMKILIGLVILTIPILILSTTLMSQLIGRYAIAQTISHELIRQTPQHAYEYMWVKRGVDNSLLLRLQTHYIGWQAIKEAPLTGHGFGSFVPTFENATGRSDVAAHNDYLRYFVETGIIGLMAYVSLQFILVTRLIRCPKGQPRQVRFLVTSVAGAYLAVNILAFLSNAYYFYEVQLWIWFGIGIAIAQLYEDKNARKDKRTLAT